MAEVVLQAGHCFRGAGATGTNGLDGDPNEQEFAWQATNRAADLLRAAGHQARVILADVMDSAYRGDCFVAVHCDGSVNGSARGASVGYRNQASAQFGGLFKAAYHARGWPTWRPDNYTEALGGYYGTRKAGEQGVGRAIIVEAGFLTSPLDEALLEAPGGPERLALAVVDAVTALFGGALPEEDDLPYSVDQLVNIFRSVLNEGAPVGSDGWAPGNKAQAANIQELINRNNFTNAKVDAVGNAVASSRAEIATVRAELAGLIDYDRLAAAIAQHVTPGGGPTLDQMSTRFRADMAEIVESIGLSVTPT